MEKLTYFPRCSAKIKLFFKEMQISAFQKVHSKSFTMDYIRSTGLYAGTDPSGAEPCVELEVTAFSAHFK